MSEEENKQLSPEFKVLVDECEAELEKLAGHLDDFERAISPSIHTSASGLFDRLLVEAETEHDQMVGKVVHDTTLTLLSPIVELLKTIQKLKKSVSDTADG